MIRNIVLEGPDGSGKSTLAAALHAILGRPVIASRGPTKKIGEIDDRLREYLYQAQEPVIFDRHPAISGTIYAKMRDEAGPSFSLVQEFYLQYPLLVYCKAPVDLSRHSEKDHDTTQHLKMITTQHGPIIEAYDKWAIEKAHIIQRPYSNVKVTVAMIVGAILHDNAI